MKTKWAPIDEFSAVIYHEIDAEGWEVRKVEYFRDGSVDYSSKERETDRSFLSEKPIPPFDEIPSDPDYAVAQITQAEFEHAWVEAVKRNNA